jgi:hypothetical protein
LQSLRNTRAQKPVRRRAGALATVFAILTASFTLVIAPSHALAAGTAVIPNTGFTGFTDVAMQRTDDGSWPSDNAGAAFPFGFNINYFGAKYAGVFINNNGNLTFGAEQGDYTPFGMAGATLPIIAPFFADVDTEVGNPVNIGTGTLGCFKVFVANWPGVECYPASNSSVLNNFQVILLDRPDLGTGAQGDDFQIEFNYNSIQWDAGTYSGGNSNCTGSPNTDAAAAGYSDGTQTAGHWYQLPGSQTSGAFLDSNTTSGLIYNDLNSNTATSVPASASPVPGRYIFTVTSGQPVTPTTIATSLSGGGHTGASITVAPSTAVTDSATLSGPNKPTAGGTLTYGVYSNNTCTTLVASAGTVTVTNGVVPASNSVTLASLGTYYWNAAYSGDSLNDPSTSGCAEVETVAVPPVAVSTVVDDAALGSAWNGSETIGATAYDTATVSGTTGFTPTGTVTYNFFTNATCAGAPATADTVTMSAGAVPKSSTTAALGAGAYSYQAAYSGDSAYAAQSSACAPFTVAKASPSLGTVVDDAALGTAWDGNEATGAAAYDTATVTGVAGYTATGTVSYSFFTNGTCAGGASTTHTVTLASGAAPNSPSTGAVAAGAYGFKANYSGDANYVASTGSCEAFAVLKAPSGVGTVVDDATSSTPWDGSETIGATSFDTATVTSVGGFTPAGTLTYTLYANATCAGSPVLTSTKTLSGGVVPNSATSAALAAGSYSFSGSYSGDANYLPATGSCEPFAVSKGSASLGTVVDDAATNAAWAGTETVGSAAYDTATLSGVSGFAPTATVTYRFFPNGTCTGTPSTTDDVTLSAGNVPDSASTGAINTGGLYAFDSSYSGDANYQAASGACEPFTVYEPPTITSADHATFVIGAGSSFTVTASGFPSGNAMSLSDGGATLPAGVAFVDNGNGTATLAGTPGLGTIGSYPFAITVTNGVAPNGTQLFTLTVAMAGTTTLLSSPTNPSVVGQTITLIASVSANAPSSGSPTGTVAFNDGGSALTDCTSQAVSSGTATCTIPFTSAGPHLLTADYSADTNFGASSGGPITQTVDGAATTTALTSSVNPAVTGQVVTYTATVSRNAPATGTAGGTVAFTDGGTTILGCDAVAVSAGVATCTETVSEFGPHAIVASFTGDADDGASIAPTVVEQVDQDATTTTVTSDPNPSTLGGVVTITVTVKAESPGSGNPTGSVTIFADGKSLATVALDSTVDSRAIYNTKALTVGVHAITATYGGDTAYETSAATASGDAQRVMAAVSVPETGGGPSGWGPLAALMLLLNGMVLLAVTRRRRR